MIAENYPTKFLGIPVDGTKEEMIRNIQAKGFKLHKEYGQEFLSGEFNGQDVHVFVATNNNKVYRVMVAEQNRCSVGQIRIRFNNLMQQFKDNPKYVSYDINQTSIPAEEDISYEMIVHDKIYDANFVQKSHELDTTLLHQDMEYITKNLDQYLPTSVITEMESEVLVQYCLIQAFLKQYEKNMVWFRICDFQGEYYLTLYYDNLYNKANGEDL